MAKKRRSSLRILVDQFRVPIVSRASSDCFEGERLDNLLSQLAKSVELAKLSKGELPEKIWIKTKGSRINETVDEILGGATSADDTLEMA
ncbi:Ribosomal protein L7Ae/L30e/S12e/Gadd45 family [Musa troglodytarum]|uniref:Ribosomal protein L7Ae/L30e/S12e/Gadd45 family n=1 Tax=Musa troglodytarum TaxID=320322 RepID=A0A9E7I4T9_9LILI|nr:Ribosomal protein L7Ae/L30e/S12e/Gadd45 family [Musa troglodytarum]